jgi:signal transduction histidine kinase
VIKSTSHTPASESVLEHHEATYSGSRDYKWLLSTLTSKPLRFILAVIWFVFTVSLSGWWVIFGLQQIDNLMELKHDGIDILVRHQKMLLWEGGALFVSLVLGGSALAYFMVRERRQSEQVQRFLATFTHELKTPLASLRLQAESLQDSRGSPEHSQALLQRLVADTARLTLQLNNCLFVADATSKGIGKRSLRIEPLSLRAALQAIAPQWPSLTVHCPQDATLLADARGLESILQNLLQNAVTHGKASRVEVLARPHSQDHVSVLVQNNGAPFKGNRSMLGKLFARFYSGSGSGIGLYLVRTLTTLLGGTVSISPRETGFEVELVLPGSLRVAPDSRELP